MSIEPAARYCARGPRCVRYDSRTDKSQKLSRYNNDDLCEQCLRVRREGQAAGKASTPTRDGRPPSKNRQVLETKRAADISTFKRELVVQLYLKRGPFYRCVNALRVRRGVTPRTDFPPRRLLINLPDPKIYTCSDQIAERMSEEEFQELDMQWRDELLSIIEDTIPYRWSNEDLFFEWDGFISACVLHDPQVGALAEFAELGGPFPRGLWIESTDDYGLKYGMVAPPIRRFPIPRDIAISNYKYRTALLAAIEHLYLKPLGVDLTNALGEVQRMFPWVEQGRRERESQAERRRYIEVDEYTTEEDVRKAFRMLTEAHTERPSAQRPRRDRLTCLECALLHDERGWTYLQLAKRYGWKDPTLASKYVRDGRTILGDE